tara:strand:+ start:12349 stop:13074 length:726 start_codon:yes stop_codon:yes gene_type:complete
MLDIRNFHKIYVANWKLNGSPIFVNEYTDKISSKYDKSSKCVVICPPNVFINQIVSKNILAGGQDCSIYSEGAYTGEVSTKILKSLGCTFCIIGHSERRNLFLENNYLISKKILNCINNKIIPILCIGESLDEKNQKSTKQVLEKQLIEVIPKEANENNLIIAYEPLWAIGTGIIPKFDEIFKIHTFIKKDISQTKNFRILYGGSVNQSNCKDILRENAVDGLLIGGASLKINEFNKIIES